MAGVQERKEEDLSVFSIRALGGTWSEGRKPVPEEKVKEKRRKKAGGEITAVMEHGFGTKGCPPCLRFSGGGDVAATKSKSFSIRGLNRNGEEVRMTI